MFNIGDCTGMWNMTQTASLVLRWSLVNRVIESCHCAAPVCLCLLYSSPYSLISSTQESPNTPGLAGPDTATLHYQSRMSLCLTQMRVNKYFEEADLCISGGGGTGNAVTSRERLGNSLIPAEKKWRLGDKNHCLGDGEEGRWGWRKHKGSSKDTFYDDPKQNEL